MSPGMVVVDNHGIGYQMMVPMRGESFPKIGQEIKIYTHMHVREDDVSLFGFLSKEEKEAFELLIGVNGIGPKVGLSVLSTLSVYELKMAVISEDVKTISKTPGLGPKGAKKLILELKDKLSFEELEEDVYGECHYYWLSYDFKEIYNRLDKQEFLNKINTLIEKYGNAVITDDVSLCIKTDESIRLKDWYDSISDEYTWKDTSAEWNK